MKKQFTLNRRGTFRTKISVSNQCKAPGHKKYIYDIKATCGPKLDPSGFIIDHVIVDRAVQTAAKHIDSCERLCEAIAGMLKNVFKTHGAKLNRIYVRIQPFGKNIVAFMEYEEEY
jgi:hypothetical protein